jgi:hypothetical protein
MAELVVAVPPLLRADQAEQRYNEAVQAAVEKCAADTAGQTCFICMDGAAAEGLVRGCACRGGAGFAHVSCLARQAKILCDEAEDNHLGRDIFNKRWERWHTCGLCEQKYHGDVKCALGWACHKTYVGRPETDWPRRLAMSVLGCGLCGAELHEDALSVREAELSILRRVGAPEDHVLCIQGNLANSYYRLGQGEEALSMYRDVYSGYSRRLGEQHAMTIAAADNYAMSLINLRRFDEAKSLSRKTLPVVRRVFGDDHDTTLRARTIYAATLYEDAGATLDDLRESVTTFEEVERTMRRVLGGAHPNTMKIEIALQQARAKLRARETPPASASASAAMDYAAIIAAAPAGSTVEITADGKTIRIHVPEQQPQQQPQPPCQCTLEGRLREDFLQQLKAENAALRERRTQRRLG